MTNCKIKDGGIKRVYDSYTEYEQELAELINNHCMGNVKEYGWDKQSMTGYIILRG